MDATTLLGTLLAELLEGTARLAVRATGWPSPARLVEGSLTAGARMLLVVAAVAWVLGVFAVLVAVSDRGGAGAPAVRGPRPAPPLPPRRVRAAAPEQVPEQVLAPVVPVEVVTVVAEVVAPPIAVAAPETKAPVSLVAPAPERDAAPVREVEPAKHHARLLRRPHGAARTTAAEPRCRRCTQPRCWPSTGERHPARAAGTGAPRACRTSLTAGTAHRCTAAAPWCGHERCAVPVRARPARPGPGSDRATALPR